MPQIETTSRTETFDPEWEAWVDSLEEVDYPPEVVARWDKEIEIMDAQIATGALVPMTADEFIAKIEAEIESERGKV